MKKLTLPLALTALLASGSANALLIDDFNTNPPLGYSASAEPGIPIVSGNYGTSTGGGSYARTVDATASGQFLDVHIDTTTNPNIYAHSQGSGVTGISTLTYALGGIDLTADGSNAFRLQLFDFDISNATFGVAINGGVFNMVGINTVWNANGQPFTAPRGYADFLFSEIVGDETNVTTLAIRIDGSTTNALDMSIDNVQTVCSTLGASGGSGMSASGNLCSEVSEPGSINLMGIGLMSFGITGLSLFRRRQATKL